MPNLIYTTRLIAGRDFPAALAVFITFVLAGSFCLDFVVHEVMYRTAATQLSDLTEESVRKTDTIFSIAISQLQSMQQRSLPRCSLADLVQLREDIFNRPMLVDAGWFQGQQILCSSLVALHDDNSLGLAPVAQLRNGLQIYRSDHRFAIQQQPTMILRLGNAYVNAGVLSQQFTGPSWITFSVSVGSSRNFYSDTLDPKLAWLYTTSGKHRARHRVYATACSTRFELCNTASLSEDYMLTQGKAALAVGNITGGLLGGMLFGALFTLYRWRKTLESQLARAIRKQRLYIEYQPIVRLHDHVVVGAEALCRWRNEDGQQIAPEYFIPIAEQRRWIGELTLFVLRRALTECGPMLAENPRFTISINLSPHCLRTPDFLDRLQWQMALSDISPASIAFEITESAAAHDLQLTDQIQQLRASGHPIHLDDFGAGYSSLSYLHELRIDALKIDRAFLRAIGTHAIQVDILPQILSIAEKLNLHVVIEGIESTEQESYLEAISPTLLGQGWLYGRPACIAELEARLTSQPVHAS